jgi:hypothetical protein
MADLASLNFRTVTDSVFCAAVEDFIGSSLPQVDRQSEGYGVDFKEEWGDRALRVVAGFANTFGGTIIVGVSEKGGRADQVVGVPSAGEIKTRIASSISSNISPVPDFELAECVLPSDPSRRLAVIRVRSGSVIHFLLKKGEQPVYIRNEDQAIPAPAAELRALIDRERNYRMGATPGAEPFSGLPAGFKITRPNPNFLTINPPRAQRLEAQSFMRIVVQPSHQLVIDMDYQQEERFKSFVAARFKEQLLPLEHGLASQEESRSAEYYLRDVLRGSPDIHALWLLTGSGRVGFATTLGIVVGSRPAWSVPDAAANIVSTLGVANDVLAASGYFGPVRMDVEVVPAGAVIMREGQGFPALIRKDVYKAAWPAVIPNYVEVPSHRSGIASIVFNFSARSGDSRSEVAEVLNRILCDLGFAADSGLLRSSLR